MELTVRNFLQNIRGISNLLSDRRMDIINDTISIIFLSELINGCSGADEKELTLANSAAREIIRHVGYPTLHRYKNQINTAVMNSCIGPNLNRTIRILIGPDELERQALLKERYHFEDAPFKARLEDSIAIEGLRVKYQNARSFDEKESVIRQIFVSGQIELIKMVIADFNNPLYNVFIYRTAPPCTSRSTQFETLQGLRRMYPDEKLLNEDFLKIVYNLEVSSEQTKQYLEAVTRWLERKYAIKIEDRLTAYILNKGCVNINK
jgi:hypothetical protein